MDNMSYLLIWMRFKTFLKMFWNVILEIRLIHSFLNIEILENAFVVRKCKEEDV